MQVQGEYVCVNSCVWGERGEVLFGGKLLRSMELFEIWNMNQEIHKWKLLKFAEHAGFIQVAIGAAFAVLAWGSWCLMLYKEATVESLQ